MSVDYHQQQMEVKFAIRAMKSLVRVRRDYVLQPEFRKLAIAAADAELSAQSTEFELSEKLTTI